MSFREHLKNQNLSAQLEVFQNLHALRLKESRESSLKNQNAEFLQLGFEFQDVQASTSQSGRE